MNRPWFSPSSGGGAVPTGFFRLKFGAGGFITGFDSVGGMTVMRTDAFGAYVRNETATNTGNDGSGGVWVQLCTTGLLPSSFWYPTGIGGFNPWQGGDGSYEIRIAPSDNKTCYMTFLGRLFYTTQLDQMAAGTGGSWTGTALADKHFQANIAANYPLTGRSRISRYKMAVDPNNKNVVYISGVGTVSGLNEGVYMTIGGTTGGSWTTISPSPIPYADTTVLAGTQGNVCIAFDPNSGTVTVPNLNGLGSATVTKTIAIGVAGSGVYISNDGGQTWTLVANNPGTSAGVYTALIPSYMAFAPSGASGTFQATSSNNGSLYYVGSSWVPGPNIWDCAQGDMWWVTNLGGTGASANWSFQKGNYSSNLNGGITGVVFDPTNANRLILSAYTAGGQEANYSAGSLTYNSFCAQSNKVCGDIPYLATGGFIGAGNLAQYPKVVSPCWDTIDTTRIWVSGDQSPMSYVPGASLTSSSRPVFTNRGAGVEELVPSTAISYSSGTAIIGGQDISTVRQPNWGTGPANDKYALSQIYSPGGSNLSQSFSFTYAANEVNSGTTSTIFGNIGTDLSGSEFSPPASGYSNNDGASWTPFPHQVSIDFSRPGTTPGNLIPASTTDIIWCTSTNGGPNSYHTTNGGATSWTDTTSTMPANVMSGIACICADPVNTGTYYAGSYRSLTQVATNATTAAGSNVLNFASTSAIFQPVGRSVVDFTNGAVIPGGTTVLSVTSTTVTISNNVTGAGVGNGDNIGFGPVPTDGTYVSTDGVNWTQTSTWNGANGSPFYPNPANIGGVAYQTGVPGHAKHVFQLHTPDRGGIIPLSFGGFNPTGTSVAFTSDATVHYTGGSTGAVWMAVGANGFPGFGPIMTFGFGIGPVAPGHSYPSLYHSGFMPQAGGQWSTGGQTYNLGHYRCIDFNPATASGTWTLLNPTGNSLYDYYVQWPQIGTGQMSSWVSAGGFGADPFVYGRVIGTQNSCGFLYGNFP